MALQQGYTLYKEFMDNVVGLNHAGVYESDRRVQFLLRNYDMIPKNHRELILSLTRSYPTLPVYIFLVLGMLGSNISRFGAIARQGCHTDQWERAGAFYMLMGESRLGKGIAMNLLWKLEITIQQKRSLGFPTDQNILVERPHNVVLPGENSIQIQAEASRNAGCGIIFVPELKTGKAKYNDCEGKYCPLLAFYEDKVPGETFRTAETIFDINNGRIQLIGAGVPED